MNLDRTIVSVFILSVLASNANGQEQDKSPNKLLENLSAIGYTKNKIYDEDLRLVESTNPSGDKIFFLVNKRGVPFISPAPISTRLPIYDISDVEVTGMDFEAELGAQIFSDEPEPFPIPLPPSTPDPPDPGQPDPPDPPNPLPPEGCEGPFCPGGMPFSSNIEQLIYPPELEYGAQLYQLERSQ